MTSTIIETISLVGISVGAGAIAALIAPWAKWGVEKKKNKLLSRKRFLNECRRVIGKRDFELDRFKKSSLYSSLRYSLSIEIRKEIILKKEKYIPGKHRPLEESLKIVKQEQQIKNDLFNEISILEREWGLL